jgi:hypothetical protein
VAKEARLKNSVALSAIPIAVIPPVVIPPMMVVVAAVVIAIPPAPSFGFGRDECASKQECDECADDDLHGNLNLRRQQVDAVYRGAG